LIHSSIVLMILFQHTNLLSSVSKTAPQMIMGKSSRPHVIIVHNTSITSELWYCLLCCLLVHTQKLLPLCKLS